MSPENKVAIVTGGTSGIGAAICRKLASDGFRIHVSCFKQTDRLTALSEDLLEMGIPLSSTSGDITDPEICNAIISDCIDKHNRLDALILNAGVFKMGNLEKISDKDWQNLVNTNLSSAFFLLKNALSHLKKNGGNIVFLGTGSISNPVPAPDYPAYEASKAGLYVLMKSLSTEYAKFGIRTNMISPGIINTGSFGEKTVTKFSKQVPLGRLGQSQEVAQAVSFLLSQDASYINGANLDISGGWIRRF